MWEGAAPSPHKAADASFIEARGYIGGRPPCSFPRLARTCRPPAAHYAPPLQVSHANRDDVQERDARIEYLSWRVWGMKRKRATTVRATAAARAASAARRATAGGSSAAEEDGYADSEERAAALTNLYLDDLDATFNMEVRKQACGAQGSCT